MKLMTKTVRKSLPPLYATEDNATAKAVVKYFDPTGACTWYAAEFDGEDIFFGFVDMGSGYDAELGYFSLSELESIKGAWGLGIERDLHFTPTLLSDIVERYGR